MFQTLAAIFFALALIAPLAVIVLTLHGNWSKIAAALTGPTASASEAAMHHAGPRRVAKPYRTVIRRTPRPLQPVRAAA